MTGFAVTSTIVNGASQGSTDNRSKPFTNHVTIEANSATAASSSNIPGIDQEDKRTLRSKGGASRLRSELSLYFPNYDEIINDEPKEPGKLL